MDNITIGSLWSLRGSLGTVSVTVQDVVDGVNPVVIYSFLNSEDETGMAGFEAFESRYELVQSRH